jgi:hypothetical protein
LYFSQFGVSLYTQTAITLKKRNSFIYSVKILQGFVRIKRYFINNYTSFRNKLIVFLVFVLLSTVLWFYRTLDDSFVANISYPVKYQNLPKNKILINLPPEKILLRVRGSGYSLLSSKLKLKTPLNFNINSFLLYSQSNDSMSVFILTRYAIEALTDELNKKNSDLEIVSISPDSIFFNFTRTKVKRVAIRPSIVSNGSLCAKQFMVNGPIYLSPDSIDVRGPAVIIDTLKFVSTKTIQLTELTDTFRKKIRIVENDQILMPFESTSITIPVDKFTELSYNVPILTRHVPDSFNMKLFPRSVQLSFNISQSYVPKISETDFRPYVDYLDLTENNNRTTNQLTIKIDSVPYYVNALRMYPTSVEFINEINNAKSRNNWGNR